MKRIVVIVLLLNMGFAAQAQIVGATNSQRTVRTELRTYGSQQNAIGVQAYIGGWSGVGLSTLWGLGNNRVEVDLAWENDNESGGDPNIRLSGIYLWTWDISTNSRGYAGMGLFFCLYEYDDLGLGAHGQIGLEFDFPNTPLQLTVGLRPSYDIRYGRFSWCAGVGVRFRF